MSDTDPLRVQELSDLMRGLEHQCSLWAFIWWSSLASPFLSNKDWKDLPKLRS